MARVVQENGKLLLQAVLEVNLHTHILANVFYLSYCILKHIILLTGLCPLALSRSLALSLSPPQAIGGGSSRSLMEQFAEVLFNLNKHCFPLLTVWLKEALQAQGFPSTRVTTEQKDTFTQQILRYYTHV